MYKRLPYFRNLVIKYNRYRRKLTRLENRNVSGQQQNSWIRKRIDRLRSKIEQYLDLATVAKKTALLSAGLLTFGMAIGQSYEKRTEHPFYNIVGNEYAAPAFLDYDGDGDQDLILFGEASDTTMANTEAIQYYENKESTFSAGFISGFPADLGLATAIDTSTFGTDLVPSFVDYDADGDLDLFIGADEGEVRYLRNDDGMYQAVVGDGDPFDGVEFGNNPKPTLGDIDGDGDVDAYIGSSDGLTFFLNENGVLTDQGLVTIDGTDSNAAPLLFDIDSDGDLDLLVGNKYGDLYVFTNDAGTMTQVTDHPLADLKISGYANLALADLDGDGDSDLVVGDSGGTLHVYLNDNDVYSELAFNTLGVLSSGSATPEFVDFDGDGDLDLFIGSTGGGLQYYENKNGVLEPAMVDAFAGLADEISFSKPAFADYDADGDMDLLVGSYSTPVILYNNDAGIYTMVDTLDNPFFKLSEDQYQVPEFVDLDNDGDLDLVIGNKYGALLYFANNDGKFEEVLDGPLAGLDVGSYAVPAFVDLDSDGDMDLVVGAGDGMLVTYLNNDGVFEEQIGPDNPFNDFNFVSEAAPAFADLDGDNDIDVLVGNLASAIFYLENVDGSVSVDERLDVSRETLVFPNPVESIVQIRAEWNNQDGMVEIFDNQGRMVQKTKFFGSNTQLDLRNLSAGTYHMQISNLDKKATKSLFKR